MSVINMRGEEYLSGLNDLCVFLKNHGVREVVEIGCYTGTGSKKFAEHFNKVFCVDPFIGGYDDKDPASNSNMRLVEEIFDKEVSGFTNIVKIKSTSEDACKMFDKKSLQFVYLDGNHSEEPLRAEIREWLNYIMDGFFIGGHDFGYKNHPSVKEVVLEYFKIEDIKVFKDTSWVTQVGRPSLHRH